MHKGAMRTQGRALLGRGRCCTAAQLQTPGGGIQGQGGERKEVGSRAGRLQRCRVVHTGGGPARARPGHVAGMRRGPTLGGRPPRRGAKCE